MNVAIKTATRATISILCVFNTMTRKVTGIAKRSSSYTYVETTILNTTVFDWLVCSKHATQRRVSVH